jgi:hypothetical protein
MVVSTDYMSMCQGLKCHFEELGNSFYYNIITTEISWAYHCNPATNEESSHWKMAYCDIATQQTSECVGRWWW